MVLDSNFLIHIVAIYTCSMGTTIEKKAVRLAALSVGVGVMLIAGFASPTHPSLANAQQNKILMQPQGVRYGASLLGGDHYD
jgi:hypothetical protein